jgi:hypothetical protein
MYDRFDIEQIIDFLIHDEMVDDDSDINLFCPESIEDEKDILEYYVTKYCADTPESEGYFIVESALEEGGRFYINVIGFEYKIDFEYIIH